MPGGGAAIHSDPAYVSFEPAKPQIFAGEVNASFLELLEQEALLYTVRGITLQYPANVIVRIGDHCSPSLLL